MPVGFGPAFPETIYFDITIDGVKLNTAVRASMTHAVNGARTFNCTVTNKEAFTLCRLGAEIEVNVGRGNLSNLIDDKKFIGIIKDIKPKQEILAFTALDYTTFLAESQYVLYKAQDYIGEDLYFAAARACDYKGIDTSKLIQGSGIPITADMKLFGWKTRKEFIDACFEEMTVLVNDDRHPANTIKQWQYGIMNGKTMEFFLPDPHNTINFPVLTVSEENNNLLDENIVSQIDTTRIINAITVVGKDENTYVQLEDSDSQKKYGVIGKFLTYPTTDKNVLYDVAYKVLNRFKEPTVSYSVSLPNADYIDLGHLLSIDVPTLTKAAVLPVVGYDIAIDDKVSTTFQVGQTKVTVKEYIDLLSKPTDR